MNKISSFKISYTIIPFLVGWLIAIVIQVKAFEQLDPKNAAVQMSNKIELSLAFIMSGLLMSVVWYYKIKANRKKLNN